MVSRNLSSSNLNFSVLLTFDVSQIFWQRVVQPRPKYSYCILLKGLCWVSVCWILNNALCSMPWMFSDFYCVPNCAIIIWHHLLCYLPNIYNYITSRRLWREYNLSSCSLSQLFKCCTSVILYVNVRWISSIACMSFAFHWFQSWQQYSSGGMTRDFKLNTIGLNNTYDTIFMSGIHNS